MAFTLLPRCITIVSLFSLFFFLFLFFVVVVVVVFLSTPFRPLSDAKHAVVIFFPLFVCVCCCLLRSSALLICFHSHSSLSLSRCCLFSFFRYQTSFSLVFCCEWERYTMSAAEVQQAYFKVDMSC